MSERLHHPTAERLVTNERLSEQAEAPSTIEKVSHSEGAETDLMAIQKSLGREAKKHAASSKEIPVGEKAAPSTPLYLTRQLKREALQRSLGRVQKQLSTPQKVFSKIIHQPAVATISETGAQTVVRPSGVLGGGSMALIGSLFTIYLAKHYGFRYNLTLFLALFVIGFGLGLVAELLIRFIRRRT